MAGGALVGEGVEVLHKNMIHDSGTSENMWSLRLNFWLFFYFNFSSDLKIIKIVIFYCFKVKEGKSKMSDNWFTNGTDIQTCLTFQGFFFADCNPND